MALVSDPYLSKSLAYCCPEQHLDLQLSHQLRGSEPHWNVDAPQVQRPRMEVLRHRIQGKSRKQTWHAILTVWTLRLWSGDSLNSGCFTRDSTESVP